MIVCGWCLAETPADRCVRCARDPVLPWTQRAQVPPVADAAGVFRRRLAEASADIRAEGREPTIERLAERLDVSPRTVRRWREMAR